MSGKVPASLRDDDDTEQDDAMRMTMITFSSKRAQKTASGSRCARASVAPPSFWKRKCIEDLDHRNVCASGTASGPRLLPPAPPQRRAREQSAPVQKGANTLALRNGEGIASASDDDSHY